MAVRTIPQSLLRTLDHSALDSGEVTALKRCWWNLYNLQRTWGELLDVDSAMREIETLTQSLRMTVPTSGKQVALT